MVSFASVCHHGWRMQAAWTNVKYLLSQRANRMRHSSYNDKYALGHSIPNEIRSGTGVFQLLKRDVLLMIVVFIPSSKTTDFTLVLCNLLVLLEGILFCVSPHKGQPQEQASPNFFFLAIPHRLTPSAARLGQAAVGRLKKIKFPSGAVYPLQTQLINCNEMIFRTFIYCKPFANHFLTITCDSSSCDSLSDLSVKTSCHTEYNCEAFLGCEYVCVFSSVLMLRMILHW